MKGKRNIIKSKCKIIDDDDESMMFNDIINALSVSDLITRRVWLGHEKNHSFP